MIAAGKLTSILGTVSMDLTTIDITDCEGVRAGDAVVLLGSEGGVSINAQQVARWAGTPKLAARAAKSGRALTVSSDAPVRPSAWSNKVEALAARCPPAEEPITSLDVEHMRIRLCLTPDRDAEVEQLLRSRPAQGRRLAALWWDVRN